MSDDKTPKSNIGEDISALVPIHDDDNLIKTVNASDLHAYLGVRSEFRNWIKNRISQYGFAQDIDFVAGNFLPGSERTDYHITLDMAKELAMVERNEKGKEARRYFIACEKELKAKQPQPATAAELVLQQAQALVDQERRVAKAEAEQRRLDEEQRQLNERQASTERRMDQIETAQDHFTIVGWWRYAKVAGSLPLADAAKMGRAASQYCKEHDIPRGEVPDPRFGSAKTYPKWVLEELFAGAIH